MSSAVPFEIAPSISSLLRVRFDDMVMDAVPQYFLFGDDQAPNPITVHTRAGKTVKVNRTVAILPIWREADRQNQQKHNLAQPRTALSGYFNCHGLVFASRRAAITDVEQIPSILKDDNYDEISDLAAVLPGDIVIYFNIENNDAEHSGLVVAAPHEANLVKTFMIVSKWGPCGREYLHALDDCPYTGNKRFFRIHN